MNLIEKLEQQQKFWENNPQCADGTDYTDFIKEIEICIDTVKQHSDWVSVDERLPTKEKDYLVRYEQSENFGLYMAVSTFRLDTQKFDSFNSKVTHWMQLPQPPSEVR